MTSIFIELFITGLILGWGPCLVCSHVTYPYFIVTKKTFKQGAVGAIFFSAGRIVAYSSLGGLACFSGILINHLFIDSKFTSYVNIYGGLFILLMGIIILVAGFKDWKICDFIHKWDHLNVFVLGLFTGLVPCIPFLTVLSYMVINIKNWYIGALGGAIFGFGTVVSPFIFLIGFMSRFVNFLISHINIDIKLYKSMQRIFGIIIIFLALKTILIGLIMLYPKLFLI